MKRCLHCSSILSRRENEQKSRWERRKYCGRSCSDPGRYRQAEENATERFLSLSMPEPMSGCWLWLGTLTRGNYGNFSIHAGKMIRAHRYAYAAFKGNVPSGFHVRHTCDNTYCVNPDHLLVGTNKDNCDDKVRRGRAPRGQDSCRAKLTEEQARQILVDTRKYAAIANDYSISTASVCLIKKGKNWRHIQ